MVIGGVAGVKLPLEAQFKGVNNSGQFKGAGRMNAFHDRS